MANTASISGNVQVANGSANGSGAAAFAPTLAGAHFIDTIFDVTTAAVAVPLGSVATAAYIFIKNLDTTNYIELSTDSTVFGAGKLFTRIHAGEFALFPAEPGVTYGARANTATCQTQVIIIEA